MALDGLYFTYKTYSFINYVEVKFVWQISYPPGNGASLGSFCQKLAVFEATTGLLKLLWQPKFQTLFQMVFGSVSMKDQIYSRF